MAEGPSDPPRRCSMMDTNAIDLALHEIEQMVSVAIDAAGNLNGSDDGISQMPYAKHNLLDFSLFDIEKRLKALRAGLS